jgi:hypothetical protein
MKTTAARRVLVLTVALTVLPLGAACGDHGGDRAADPASAGAAAREVSGKRLVITTDNGMRLRPADGHRVTVDRRADAVRSHHDRTWTLDLSCSDRTRDAGPCPRMPYVYVPGGLDVVVSARNAGVDVAGLDGSLDVTTVNGDVTVTRSGHDDAAVRLVTRNGSVRATALDAGRLRARTTNGDVTLACATAPSSITAATTNGSVDVTVPHHAPPYRVTTGTDNGRATVAVPTRGAPHGRTMTLATVNGDVEARQG